MDVERVIERGRRDPEWTAATEDALAGLVAEVQDHAVRPRGRLTRRRITIGLPAAVILAGALTAGGLALAYGDPDAVIPVHYTTGDGASISCEVTVRGGSDRLRHFIRTHDWSDVSARVQAAIDSGTGSTSPESVIAEEIPAEVSGHSVIDFASSCS
jgi:hypothetical protein